jgi:hypothetical protein
MSRNLAEEGINSVGESAPLNDERFERSSTFFGYPVVAPGGSARRLLPCGLDQAIVAETGQERIHGPLARHKSIRITERPGELESVAILVSEQCQYAVLNCAAPHLRQHLVSTARYHAEHSS